MDAHWLVPVGMPTRHVAHASLGEFKDTINHLFVIKLLLIVRYKFGYTVPNIPPFVGEFVCSKMKY